MNALRIVALMLLGPILSLWLVDRGLVESDALWSWVDREMPRRVADPFLVESTIRATEPGPRNVLVLGNSRADDGIDTHLLERELAGRGIRVQNLTVAGTSVLHQALIAPLVASLGASLALLVIDPVALADPDPAEGVWAYDLDVALEVFAASELLADPIFHLRGVVQQAHVLARHRQALQYSLLVRAGLVSWDEIMDEQLRQQLSKPQYDTVWHRWMFGEVHAQFPGVGTRSIQVLSRRLSERGTTLVLVEAPLHPIVPLSLARKESIAFRKDMQAFADAEEIPFFESSAFADLEVADFIDMIHLNEQGSERYTRDLARAIAPLLEGDA